MINQKQFGLQIGCLICLLSAAISVALLYGAAVALMSYWREIGTVSAVLVVLLILASGAGKDWK